MSEINYFNFFALCSGDVMMIEQLKWIARMLETQIPQISGALPTQSNVLPPRDSVKVCV
jgi:hypothetical protein